MNLKDLPKGRKLVGTKWVFKVKWCSRYRSRLVAQGYTQIPGIDYTDKFSLVVHNVTLKKSLVVVRQIVKMSDSVLPTTKRRPAQDQAIVCVIGLVITWR